MMSLRTMVDMSRAGRIKTTGAILVGPDEFFVEVGDGAFRADRGRSVAPDFTLSAPVASPIAAAIYGKVPFDELAAAGLKVDGDRQAALGFVDLFHLPAKIGAG